MAETNIKGLKTLESLVSRYHNKARGIVGEKYSNAQAMSRIFNLARGMVSPVKKSKGGIITKRK